jgi:hypothetical protein
MAHVLFLQQALCMDRGRVLRGSAALSRSQETSTKGVKLYTVPGYHIHTQAVNNYRKPPFEPDLTLLLFSTKFGDRLVCLCYSLRGVQGVAALHLYNNVNAFPRYQTLGLYSSTNF